jgi:hypothetical protein
MEQETPVYSEHNPEQRRTYNATKAKESRARKKLREAAAHAATAEEFWQKMRQSAIPTEQIRIKQWEALQERVFDQMYWLNAGWQTAPDDIDFVSYEDGLDLLDDFIAMHGLIHDETYKHPDLNDFAPQWAIWLGKAQVKDPIWGVVEGFWRDATRFDALCEENEPTRVYCLYGIRIALPQYHVRLWKQRIYNHQFCDPKAHREYDSEECYLCRFQKKHGGVKDVQINSKS